MWYREKHLNRLETLIHFTEKKTIIEAQLVAFSAEIVFLAATKDPSLTSVATAHRYVDTSGYAELWCHYSTAPKSQSATTAVFPRKWISFVLLQTSLLCGILLVDLRSRDYCSCKEIWENRTSLIIWYVASSEGRIFTRCQLDKKRTNAD